MRMRGEPMRIAALTLLLGLVGCASVPRDGVTVVDATTDVPAVLCMYGYQGDLNLSQCPEGMRHEAIGLAAWSDGKLICRGDGGFEGDLGRVQIDAASVAAAREEVAKAIESVPIERRVYLAEGYSGLAVSVSWKGSVLQLACSADPEPTEAMNHAQEACSNALFGLIPEHARQANPPAPNFDVLDPASVRVERIDARDQRKVPAARVP